MDDRILTPGKLTPGAARRRRGWCSSCVQSVRDLGKWVSCLLCRCESHSDVSPTPASPQLVSKHRGVPAEPFELLRHEGYRPVCTCRMHDGSLLVTLLPCAPSSPLHIAHPKPTPQPPGIATHTTRARAHTHTTTTTTAATTTPQRGHALAAVLAAAMPVAVSLVVCQAPSLLQAHKVEELALVLWGGWAIGALGGAASAYQTHLSWVRGSVVTPSDVVCFELVFTCGMLVAAPQFRSQSLVALACGMLAMSLVRAASKAPVTTAVDLREQLGRAAHTMPVSKRAANPFPFLFRVRLLFLSLACPLCAWQVVVELGRSRIIHDALSPGKALEREQAYRCTYNTHAGTHTRYTHEHARARAFYLVAQRRWKTGQSVAVRN